MKKLALRVAWFATFLVLVISALLFAPGLIARSLIRGIDTEDASEAQRSLRHLARLGRSAVPALIESAVSRDLDVDSFRAEGCPPYVFGGPLAWLQQIQVKQWESSTERRANLCAAALVHPFNAGWIPESDRRRVIGFFQSFALSLPKPDFPEGTKEIPVYVGDNRWLGIHSGTEPLWLKSKVEIIVDGTSEDPRLIIPKSDWHNVEVVGDKPTPAGSNTMWNYLAAGGGGARGLTTIRVDARVLATGSHNVSAWVHVGPGEPTTRGTTDKPPPWFETFKLGPVEFDIVSPAE